MEIILYIIILLLVVGVIYDKYIQRKHQLLINYPLIGRMRYFFEAVREPFRQYFADETFYESKDKVDWVYGSSYDHNVFVSFSPNQHVKNPKFLLKHANVPLNNDEVNDKFQIIFGEKREKPFIANTIVSRSAMSDGAISPEGTRAFAKGAYDGGFPINTGEGSLTSNFFITHEATKGQKYLNIIKLNNTDKKLYKTLKLFVNTYWAVKYFRNKYLEDGLEDTYIFDFEHLLFFRPNWDAPLKEFPKEVPTDMPDIIFQMSSGLYGVRNEDGSFSEDRYKKTMAFCKMTEIKLAQGAKQTGGKLPASKVSDAIGYYRGVKAGENLFSPNRFPYASSVKELFDFVGKLQKLSNKPVGFKIVVSSKEQFEEYATEIKYRKEHNIDGVPDFISVDGGDGGTATAPIFLMDSVGFSIRDSIFIVNNVLKEYGLRDDIKIIASSKILTPDDIAIILALGADFTSIGRGFMLSAGCIRARMCSGAGSHQCPVGLATQDKKLRRSYIMYKQAEKIANYHRKLLEGVKTILAVMGKKSVSELSLEDLTFIDRNGFIHSDIEFYYKKKVKES
jgi:glutamate synthase domain-containing protein 2